MSLKDTIVGARQEAQEAGSVLRGKEDTNEKNEDTPKTSTARRASAARARPVQDAASSVRVVSAADAKLGRSGKKASEMTREERKAERNIQRSKEDRRVTAANVLLDQQKEYRRSQRLWWIMLGVGFALTAASFVLTRVFPIQADGQNTMPNIAAIVVLVVAYLLIIVSFIYDWRKVRPLRKAAEEKANGMTDRQIKRLLEEDAAARAAKAEAKKAKRHKGNGDRND